MPTQARVIWDPSFTAYNFGLGHPMAPVRLDLTARLCEAFGLFNHPDVEVFNPQVPDDAMLETVHEPGYIAAVKAASADPSHADERRGIGTEDDPAFVGMHDASARIAAGTRQLCEDVWTGGAAHGVNFCGGLHHAMPGSASGFCAFLDFVAAGAKRGTAPAGARDLPGVGAA
jgi:acetoin utilization protein AcuC